MSSTLATRTPTASDVRARIRRTTRSSLSWQSKLGTAYELALYVAVLGGITYELLKSQQVTNGPDTSSALSEQGTGWIVAWSCVVAGLVLAKVLIAFGPVFVGPTRMSWILSSPIDRRDVLRSRFWIVLLVGLLAGVLWPVLVASVVRANPGASGAAALASAAAGVVIAGSAVLVQTTRPATARFQAAASVAATLAMVAVGWGVVGDPPVTVGLTPSVAPWLAAGTVLIAVTSIARAWWSLGSLRRESLSSGAELASVAAVSMMLFEFSLLGSVLVERRARVIGRVRSARLRGSRIGVLVRADVLRVWRSKNYLLLWFGLIPLPALVDLAGSPELVPALQLVVAFLATDRLAGGLRFVCRSDAVRRMLGGPDRTLRLVHVVVPTLGALIWCAAGWVITPGVSIWNAGVSAAGAVMVVYRIATRPPLDYSAVAFDFGAFGSTPVGLIVQLSRPGVGSGGTGAVTRPACDHSQPRVTTHWPPSSRSGSPARTARSCT